MKKNRTIPKIPQPVPKPAALAEVETKPVSGLTRQALGLLNERHMAACESVAQEASKVEGFLETNGWKLDLAQLLWFRPKPPA